MHTKHRQHDSGDTQVAVTDDAVRVRRHVASFYEKLVFPSRTSHPEYASLVDGATGRVGDFGCGQSLFLEHLTGRQPQPVFLDRSWNALQSVAAPGRVQADLFQIPFQEASFGRVLCVGVVHHLPEPSQALQEMARVLEPDALLILGVYAPGTTPSRLRRLHDSWQWGPMRRLLFATTQALVWARHRLSAEPISIQDAQQRARDFLEVPYVRYASADFWVRLANAHGLVLEGMRRIAAMNLLHLRRAC